MIPDRATQQAFEELESIEYIDQLKALDDRNR